MICVAFTLILLFAFVTTVNLKGLFLSNPTSFKSWIDFFIFCFDTFILSLYAKVFGKNGPLQALPCEKKSISTICCLFIARFIASLIFLFLNFS